jgi:polyphosphate glucokinase
MLPSMATTTRALTPQRTLAVDIGGTGIKASVLDASGSMIADRVVVATPYPCPPEILVGTLSTLAKRLPPFDRASVGFPGVVRDGKILSAPEFVKVGGLGTMLDPQLEDAWSNYELADALLIALARPTRVANDADVQGLAVVTGVGLELVITLGTSVGTALYERGRLAPHMEFAHHPFRNNQTYYEQLGEAARIGMSMRGWNLRVKRAVETLDALFFFDHVYVGGGNSVRVTVDLGPKASIVDNAAGILGGIRLWD